MQVYFINTMVKIAKICSQTYIMKTKSIMLQIYTDMEIGAEKLMEVSMVLVRKFADVERKYQKFQENITIPSQACIDCLTPTDYVDTQCMYHDFCMERFEMGIGDGSACEGTLTLGSIFHSPCSCQFNLTYHLGINFLQNQCDTLECEANGLTINEFFSKLGCSCNYKICAQMTPLKHLRIHHFLNCWMAQGCVSVDECSALHSQFGQEDEGLL